MCASLVTRRTVKQSKSKCMLRKSPKKEGKEFKAVTKDTPPPRTISVGILGGANIAAKYAIAAFKSLPNVELVAIASREEAKAGGWAERYGLEAETYDSLVARDDIDVVYSPLPVGLQEEWVLKAAATGKHLICEKSMTY